MSAVINGSYPVRVDFESGSRSTPSITSAPALMPEPSANPPPMDAMGMLYELLSKQRNNDMSSGEAKVAHNRESQKAEQNKQLDALKKQEDAEATAATWGIFGKIASVIAIAVSAVAAVFSCGAASGLCIAACAISAVAFAEGEAQVLTKLTGNPDADKAFQIGAGIAAAICTGGAGIGNLAVAGAKTAIGVLGASGQIASGACSIAQQSVGAVDDKGCKDAAMAFGMAGAACALTGSLAGVGNAAQSGAHAVKAVADVTKGAVEVGAGVTTIVSSQYKADATDRGADAKQAELSIKRLQQLAEFVVDGVKDTDKSHERALRTLSGAMQTQAQTLTIASARV